MAIAYGSLTVSGLTDIADIYFEYALAVSNANVTNSYTFSQAGELGWTVDGTSRITPPTWVSGYRVWVREVKVKTDIATKVYGTPYPDTAVNQTNEELVDLQLKVKKIWSNSTGSYMASGIGDADINIDNPSTYGFNSKTTTTGISFNYNAIPLTELGINGLKLYAPVVTNDVITNKNLGMELTTSALTLYDPYYHKASMVLTKDSLAFNKPNSTVAAATLTSNGLNIVDGLIQLGTNSSSGISNGNITLSNTDFNRSINGISRDNLRLAIGQYFGVKNDGTLYAANAVISGTINITSSGSNVYTTDQIDSKVSDIDNHLSSVDQDLAIKSSIQTEQASGLLASFETVEYPALEVNIDIPYTEGGAGVGGATLVTNGKNLLFDSETMSSWGVGSGGSISNGIATLVGSSSDWTSMLYTPTFGKNIYNGSIPYVLSFDYKSSKACQLWVAICGTNVALNVTTTTRTKYRDSNFTLPSSNGNWSRYSFIFHPNIESRVDGTIAISDLTSGSGEVVNGFLQFYVRTNDTNIQIKNVQFEVGTEATEYEKTSNNIINIDFDRIVYGGSYNVISGLLTVTHNSNGQLANEENYNLTPQKIQLLNGINNIYSNLDSVSVVYAVIDANTLSTLQQIQSNNDILQSQNETITSNLNDTDKLVREYIGNTGYITMINDRIEIGQDKNNNEASTLVLTPEAIKFYGQRNDMGTGTNDKPVAQITQTELEIDKANLQTEMQMGNFLWTIDESSRKLILMYTG